jgi:hypothetical protein
MGYTFNLRPNSVKEAISTRPLADLEEFKAGIGNMGTVQVLNFTAYLP